MKKSKTVKTIELFAGVGGFRVGLNKIKSIDLNGFAVENNKNYDFVFFNQWEPNSKSQYAYKCYSTRFNIDKNIWGLSNVDISSIAKKTIPDHDLLVGGFPCQDYSVARTLNNEQGIKGKKGVLWWEIYKILKEKNTNFLLLENVDRLLISPSKQRGRDFSIMLKCFDELGYAVEWKVINAANYSMPQKRKRIFIFAYKKTTNYYLNNKYFLKNNIKEIFKYIFNYSLFSKHFKNDEKFLGKENIGKLSKDINEISESFSFEYYDTGIMINSKIFTCKTKPAIYPQMKLSEILLKENEISQECYILNELWIDKLKYLKDSKKIVRIKNGYEYKYTEGKMSFPDNVNLPGRTMLTSEGTINRSSHVIMNKGKYRFLDPKECELLNMFPKDWTNIEGISSRARRFLMGNALVCGILEKISDSLYEIIKENI